MRACQKFGHVLGSVNVEHQPWKTQHVRVQALRERLIEMRAKTSRTKAALDAIGRGAHQRVGACAIGGRNDNQAAARRRCEAAEILWRYGRNIDRDQQHRRSAHFHRAQTRGVGGNTVADLLIFFKDQHAGLTSVLGDLNVAGCDHNAMTTASPAATKLAQAGRLASKGLRGRAPDKRQSKRTVSGAQSNSRTTA